jgi:hypothetical protein
MKLFSFFLILPIFEVQTKKLNFIPTIISQVVEELFIKPEINFDILIFNVEKSKIEESVKKFLKDTKNSTSVEVFHARESKNLTRDEK